MVDGDQTYVYLNKSQINPLNIEQASIQLQHTDSVIILNTLIQMSQPSNPPTFFRRQAKNYCNQFLIDSLLRLKVAADMRRLEAQSSCYSRIIVSISKYPIPIICEEQCQMLDGVGPKMSKLLKGMIHKQYRAFLIGDAEAIDTGLSEGMSVCEAVDKQEQEIELKKIHSVREEKERQISRTQDDLESVKSMSSICSGKYSIKEGSSASLLLRILNTKPEQFWSKKQIKAALSDQQPISTWNFVKTLIKRMLITTRQNNSIVQYQITLFGQSEIQAYQQKHKPNSELYHETLRRIESKQQSPSTSKPIQRSYLSREDLLPFQITLVIDTREIKDKQTRQYFYKKLSQKYEVNCRVGVLSVGDFMWVLDSQQKGTFVLDYIIERKAADDLAASVMDGRYKHQKYRLKNCGIENVYYMVEGHPSTHCVVSQAALESAVRKTQLKERFKLIKTQNTRESLIYLSEMHKAIDKSTRASSQIAVYGSYERFNQVNSKSFMTMNDLTGLMLKSLPDVGKVTTLALVSKFGTMKELYEHLRPLDRKERIKLLDCIIKQTNKTSHEAIARMLIQILFAY